MEAELNEYYRQIQRSLCCPRKYRKKFLEDLKNNIACDCQNDPQFSYADVLDKYGSPDQLASSYIAALDENAYRSQFQNKKLIKRWGVACVALIACGLIAIYIIAFTYIRKATPVYYDIETTEEELP